MKGKQKNFQKQIKIPNNIITEYNREHSELIIDTQKECNNCKEGESIIINIFRRSRS